MFANAMQSTFHDNEESDGAYVFHLCMLLPENDDMLTKEAGQPGEDFFSQYLCSSLKFVWKIVWKSSVKDTISDHCLYFSPALTMASSKIRAASAETA